MPFWKRRQRVSDRLRQYRLPALPDRDPRLQEYSRKYLETVRYAEPGFSSSIEIIAQGMICNLTFQEVPIVTRYFPEASSINFGRSVGYGFGVLWVLLKYMLHRAGVLRVPQFQPPGK
jgi:hypothetical protein